MTTSVEEFLITFDRLPQSERLDVAVEILRRVVQFEFPPLSEEDLILNAEEIFLEFDRQEKGV
ncbi:hypothetical protein IQ264_13755 [Phormidium sp. LEGE 05292]|uniref:hypothetical protein n=1 Tax=[Phormidium] sp. LEGE 05292 TaxID=767427 RepID=UPI001881BFEB|nr:hypothetical protein [Phormidium sp. LEGE 05292]MBE9226488.1 hypothetical protein [Phormidium sp. LEGE 05292]